MTVEIRTMSFADAAAVSSLLPDLGYEASVEQVEQRFLAVKATQPAATQFVALTATKVVGWCHVHSVLYLQSEPFAEIAAIVVRQNWQGQGVGRQLIQAAEAWAIGEGFNWLRLRSGAHRTGAHLFYQSLGYRKVKASYAFERILSPKTSIIDAR